MSKKDFKRGVEAAVNAQQGFNQKQAEATEEVARRVVRKIDDLGNIVDVALDDLNTQEKERLYALKDQFDPKNLGENEKELLVSLLYTLIMQHGQDTEQQVAYYRYVRKYLEVANPSGDCDLSVVENIENISEAKGIYYIVCEFLFLKHGDHSYQDEFSDFLGNFYVRPNDVTKTINEIDTKYEIMGAEEIVRHFDLGYSSVLDDDSEEQAQVEDTEEKTEENINSDDNKENELLSNAFAVNEFIGTVFSMMMPKGNINENADNKEDSPNEKNTFTAKTD